MTAPNWWADEIAYARRDAEREQHATREHVGGPGWWPTADDRDDLSGDDYR